MLLVAHNPPGSLLLVRAAVASPTLVMVSAGSIMSISKLDRFAVDKQQRTVLVTRSETNSS